MAPGKHICRRPLVGRGGLEPPTSRLSGVRSNHLSYRPLKARSPGWTLGGRLSTPAGLAISFSIEMRKRNEDGDIIAVFDPQGVDVLGVLETGKPVNLEHP